MTRNESPVKSGSIKSCRRLWLPRWKKRGGTSVFIERQTCVFFLLATQYRVFNRQINGGRLVFSPLFFFFPNGRKICGVDCSVLAGPGEFWETERGGSAEQQLKESLFKPSQFNFLTGLLNSLLESLQKILFCAAPLCLSSRKPVVCLRSPGSPQPIYAS